MMKLLCQELGAENARLKQMYAEEILKAGLRQLIVLGQGLSAEISLLNFSEGFGDPATALSGAQKVAGAFIAESCYRALEPFQSELL